MMIDRSERINMFCIKCGARLPDGSAFCSKCGARLGAGNGPDNGVNNIQQPNAGGQNPPVRRLGEDTQSYGGQPGARQGNATGTGRMNSNAVRGNTPRRSAGAGTAGGAARKAVGTTGSRLAAIAGGGLLKKILIGAAVVIVGGGIISAVVDTGGGGYDPGDSIIIDRDNKGNSGDKDNGAGNGGKTDDSKDNADGSKPGGNTSGQDAASGIKMSVDEVVYAPGETITVEYEGVTSKLVENGAWIGLAEKGRSAEDHLFMGDFMDEGSGRMLLMAPTSAGDYEIRYYQNREATEESLVKGATIDITVVMPVAEKIPDPDFDASMYRYYYEGEYDREHRISVGAHGENVTFGFPAIDDYGSRDDWDNTDEVFIYQYGEDNHTTQDAYTVTGIITSSSSGTDDEGDYYLYSGEVTGFTGFTSYYEEHQPSFTRKNTKYYNFNYNENTGHFSIRVYSNGHHQAYLYLVGDCSEEYHDPALIDSKGNPMPTDGVINHSKYPIEDTRLGEDGVYYE